MLIIGLGMSLLPIVAVFLNSVEVRLTKTAGDDKQKDNAQGDTNLGIGRLEYLTHPRISQSVFWQYLANLIRDECGACLLAA